MKNIVLIGIMGCGKSTIGRLLSEKLNLSFVDMDNSIENKTKMKINDIFKTYGEDYFRTLEEQIAEELSKKSGLVISTGGGIVTKEESISYLKNNGIVIFLKRDLNDILKINMKNRPLLNNNPEKIFEIMNQRKALYEKYSDFCISNDDNPKNTVEKIIEIIKKEENWIK